MLIKEGVLGMGRLHTSMRKVKKVVTKVWQPEEPIITSAMEGNHSAGSFHYIGRALDFRIPSTMFSHRMKTLREKLGENYDVVVEQTHIHIEYDPK